MSVFINRVRNGAESKTTERQTIHKNPRFTSFRRNIAEQSFSIRVRNPVQDVRLFGQNCIFTWMMFPLSISCWSWEWSMYEKCQKKVCNGPDGPAVLKNRDPCEHLCPDLEFYAVTFRDYLLLSRTNKTLGRKEIMTPVMVVVVPAWLACLAQSQFNLWEPSLGGSFICVSR